MFKAVGLQAGATLVGIFLAWLLSGPTAAWFFFLGGIVVVVPNALFALRLWLHRNRAPESYPVVFFLGEFVKIALTIGGLGLVFQTYYGKTEEVAWLALMLGLIIVLKAPLAIWWLERNKT